MTCFIADRLMLSFGSGGKLGVLGDVLAFHFNPEEQNRGSLHYHGMLWLKYKPDAQTFRSRLEQPAFQQRILHFLGEIIKHEAPAQWKNPDPHSLGMLKEAQQELKHIDCPHCNTTHDIIIQCGQAQSSANTDQHLSCKRIADPAQPQFSQNVLRDLTMLVGEMVTHNANHHTSCFKYVKRSKRAKAKPHTHKDCRYHFPKELGMQTELVRACLHYV